MRIMIVDDEVIIRTGLAKVIKWDEIGMELLPPASSAEEALERIPVERPNVLLTDIRMTGKTGLELAKEAKLEFPDMEVIILSGYDDFTYMQQAIRQEVSDYLLKTSRPEEIIKTVLRAKQRIEERQQAQSKEHFMNKEMRNGLFERWMVHGDTFDVESQLKPVFGSFLADHKQGEAFQTLIITAEGWDESPASESLLLFAVENMLNDILKCETLIRKKQVIMAIRVGNPGVESERQLRSGFQKIENLLKCQLFAAAGSRVDRPEELHTAYSSAEYTASYKELIHEKYWSYSDIKKRSGGKSICSHEEELQLSAIMLENEPVALKCWVQATIQEQLNDPNMTLESLESLVQSIVLSTHRWLDRVLAATGRGGAAAESSAQFQYKASANPKDSLFQHLYSIMNLYHQQLAAGQATHVQRAMAYIQENVGNHVGLQQVARHVHLHPNHLSEVFKKETGVTFGDYVTRQRIQLAMEILSVSPEKISEVAAKVGYEDVKYFGQIFKKLTGKTPSEYREDSAAHNGRNE